MAVDDRSLNLPLPNDLFSLHLSANSGGYRPNQALLSCPPAAEQKTTSSQQGAQHQRESTRLRNSGIGRQIGRQNRGITAALSVLNHDGMRPARSRKCIGSRRGSHSPAVDDHHTVQAYYDPIIVSDTVSRAADKCLRPHKLNDLAVCSGRLSSLGSGADHVGITVVSYRSYRSRSASADGGARITRDEISQSSGTRAIHKIDRGGRERCV